MLGKNSAELSGPVSSGSWGSLDVRSIAMMDPRRRQATLAGITQEAIDRARWVRGLFLSVVPLHWVYTGQAYSAAGLASLSLSNPEVHRLLSSEHGVFDHPESIPPLGLLGAGDVTHPEKLCPMVCGPDVSVGPGVGLLVIVGGAYSML